MIPWENVVFFGEDETTGARVIGILVAAFWLLTVLVTGKFRRLTPFHVAVYVFVLWNVISMLWSINTDLTLEIIQSYVQLAILALILWDLFDNSAALNAGLQAYVLGAYVAIVSTIVNYLSGIDSVQTRFAATGFNENDLGITLALGLPMAWHLALSRNQGRGAKLLTFVNYAYIPAATLAIILTGSRGALIAAVPAFFFVIWSFVRLKPSSRVLLFMTFIGVLFVLQPFVPQTSIQRLATIGTSIAELDLGGRVDIWRQGIIVFSEHPLFGIGSGAFGEALESGLSAHNSFLSVLVEVGLIGLALFAIILAMTVRQATVQSKWAARLWLSILAVWTIGSSSAGWEARKPTWLILSLVVVAASLTFQNNESFKAHSTQSEEIEEYLGLA